MEKQNTLYGELDISLATYGHADVVVAVRQCLVGRPAVRIQSSCVLAEVFGSNACECRAQIAASLQHIAANGGAFVYLEQEGRGAGLSLKMRAMQYAQEQRVDSAAAYAALGVPPDQRDYAAATMAMRDIFGSRNGIEIELITNNPRKIQACMQAGFVVADRLEPQLSLSQAQFEEMIRVQRALGHIEYSNAEAR